MTEPIDRNIRDVFAAQEPNASEWHSGPVLEMNFPELLELTRDMDLSEDQARELIQTYWNIAMHFVQMGFGIHPVQLVAGGEKDEKVADMSEDFLASSPSDMVQLQDDSDEKTSEELEPEGGAP